MSNEIADKAAELARLNAEIDACRAEQEEFVKNTKSAIKWEETDFNGSDVLKAKYLHDEDYLGVGTTEEEVLPWNNEVPEATPAKLNARGSRPWKSYVEKTKVARTKMFGVEGAFEALKGDNAEELTWKEVFPLQMQQTEENFYHPDRLQMTPFQPTAQEKIKQASIFQMMLSVIKKQHTAEGMETIIKMAEYENSENEASTGEKVYENADEIATKFCERNIYKLRPKAEPPKTQRKQPLVCPQAIQVVERSDVADGSNPKLKEDDRAFTTYLHIYRNAALASADWALGVKKRDAWLRRYYNILRWYTKAVEDTRKGDKVEKRTVSAKDIEPYTRCRYHFCTWTVCGAMPKKRVDRVAGENQSETYKQAYRVEADIANGRWHTTEDHRDDGRGDIGRLKRYKQAYEDHEKLYHKGDMKLEKQEPPTFTARMSLEDYEEELEKWGRYRIANPQNTPEILYNMLHKSIDSDLIKVIKSDLLTLNNRADEEDIQKILKVIKLNAVHYVANDVLMRAFEKLKQEPGEKIDPYFSKLKSAAARIKLPKVGSCSEKNCQTIPQNGVKQFPCQEAKEWTKALQRNAESGSAYVTDDVKLDGKTCPHCCREEEDLDRKDWMIRKHFYNNIRKENIKRQIMNRLQADYTAQGGGTDNLARFDILRFPTNHILKVARQAEATYGAEEEEKSAQVAGVTGSGQGRNNPKNGKKDQNGGKKKNQAVGKGGMLNDLCVGCGDKPHGPKDDKGKPTNPAESRKAHCKAWGKTCDKCKKSNHFNNMCRAPQKKGGKKKPIEGGSVSVEKGAKKKDEKDTPPAPAQGAALTLNEPKEERRLTLAWGDSDTEEGDLSWNEMMDRESYKLEAAGMCISTMNPGAQGEEQNHILRIVIDQQGMASLDLNTREPTENGEPPFPPTDARNQQDVGTQMEPVCGNGCREGVPCDSMAQHNEELTQQRNEQDQQTEEPTQQERTTTEGDPKAKKDDSTGEEHRLEFCPDTNEIYTVAYNENGEPLFPRIQQAERTQWVAPPLCPMLNHCVYCATSAGKGARNIARKIGSKLSTTEAESGNPRQCSLMGCICILPEAERSHKAESLEMTDLQRPQGNGKGEGTQQ